MFIKYITKNLKNNFFGYLLIAILEIFMLCAILSSNGIISNSISEENNAKYEASSFFLAFDEPINAADYTDKIDEFSNRIPYEFELISFSPTNQSEGKNADFYRGNIYLFHNHEDLKFFMEDYFNVSSDQLPTKEEFDNREKVVMVGSSGFASDRYPSAKDNVVDGYIDIMGEKYRVSGYYGGASLYLFWGTQPEGTFLSDIIIEMKDIMTEKQTKEIMSLFREIFGNITLKREQLPDTYGLLDQRASEANIGISVVLIIISVFNTLLIFKYMLSVRKQSFAVFRLCGFGKLNCILYSGTEFLLLSASSAAISCVVFDNLVKPIMAGYYGIFNIIFDINYYLFVSAGYIGISLVMFLIYIVPSLTKSVTAELRGI